MNKQPSRRRQKLLEVAIEDYDEIAYENEDKKNRVEAGGERGLAR